VVATARRPCRRWRRRHQPNLHCWSRSFPRAQRQATKVSAYSSLYFSHLHYRRFIRCCTSKLAKRKTARFFGSSILLMRLWKSFIFF
jgi:hypothetical protein